MRNRVAHAAAGRAQVRFGKDEVRYQPRLQIQTFRNRISGWLDASDDDLCSGIHQYSFNSYLDNYL